MTFLPKLPAPSLDTCKARSDIKWPAALQICRHRVNSCRIAPEHGCLAASLAAPVPFQRADEQLHLPKVAGPRPSTPLRLVPIEIIGTRSASLRTGYANKSVVRIVTEIGQLSYLSCSKKGTQSNSGGKSAKFLSCASRAPATKKQPARP